MDEQNPYSTPEATLQAQPTGLPDSIDLAGRVERLCAAILDGLIAIGTYLPLMYFGGYWDAVMASARKDEPISLGLVVFWSLMGVVVFVVVRGYPLHRWAQTWGKRAVNVRIVCLDGSQPSLLHLLVRRYLPVQLAALVPFVGNLLVIVDSLFVFRADRRCVHDLIAGTRVIATDSGN